MNGFLEAEDGESESLVEDRRWISCEKDFHGMTVIWRSMK